MKLQAKHNNKWYPIKDIAKCDDVVEYQLEGIDGKIYSSNVDDVRVEKGEITNPDGSVTRFPGKERLVKPLSKGTNLLDKWALIKAKMNHETAFKDMDIFEDEDEDKQGQSVDQATNTETSNGDSADSVQPQQEPVQPDEELQQPAEGAEDPSSQASPDASDGEDLQKLEGDDLVQSLKEHGYSDVEIAHILEGVTPKPPGEEEQDYEAHKQNLGQDNEGHKQTLGHRDEVHDVDLDHKKKLHELELEYAKREKELRLKHLEEELELKRAKLKASASGEKK